MANYMLQSHKIKPDRKYWKKIRIEHVENRQKKFYIKKYHMHFSADFSFL